MSDRARRNARRAGVAALAAALALGAGWLVRAGSGASGDLTFLGGPVAPEEIARGAGIYAEACGSCHGAKLEGQPDWKRRGANGRLPAPPHDATGHTWHHADRQLFTITKLGVGAVVPGYESDMPAFADLLSDDDIRAVLAYVKSTWPDRQRTFQAEVTAQDGDGS